MKTFTGILAVLLCLVAGRVSAQDINLAPKFGSVKLKVGFLPDPHKVTVTAGGKIQTNLGDVGAYVTKAPTFKLHYEAGNAPLTIFVTSATDTTLLINLPNGTWVANDDFNALNPQIKLDQPMSGRYDIFVGTFNEGTAPAVLKITELK